MIEQSSVIPSDLKELWPLLTPRERVEVENHLLAIAGIEPGGLEWLPLPGPQTEAFYSEADVLGYGGAAGGGKTDLLLGLAGVGHKNSIVFRRVFPAIRGIIERSREIYNCRGVTHAKDSYNETLHIWRLGDGRMVEFASMQYEADKENYRGRPKDFYGFDEATEFTESQVRFVTAWNRSVNEQQRCRVVLTFNPPTTTEGRWVISYFAPWLDDKHPNPALPGELRWYAAMDGKDVEVDGPESFEHNGELVRPKSRTFIAARLTDNPYLEKTGYRATLQSLPEPLRSQMLYGDFKASMSDDPWQVIPTAWIDAAIERGKVTPKPTSAMSALGADPSRGGRDGFVMAPRWDNWFGELTEHHPGKNGMPAEIDGPIGAKLVLDCHEDGAEINVDVIGIGASTYDSLKDVPGLVVNPINNAEAAKEWVQDGLKMVEVPMRDKSGKLKLTNVRTASYWKMREALDPESGQDICLPDDAELRADLMAPTYKVTAAGIVVEPKTGKGSISERLGRSPGRGDAVVMANWIPSKPPVASYFVL